MENRVNTNFPITVYGKMEKFNDTISRGRCRIFYKYDNRNGTYITDEFAEKLIASLPYTPIKGIHDGDDYTDHGTSRSEGRIYGVVPANPHVSWEKHLDPDGKEREYVCCDVLYYTALYSEAGEIDGKSQSMELYRKTLKGAWQYVGGKKYYVFSEGSFLGLQALGDDVEPCFEGAGFFSKNEQPEDTEEGIIALLRQYEKRPDIFQYREQGGNIMPEVNFKISDGQKYEYLWSLLNPNYNEANDYAIECVICDVYDEYAIVRNLSENTFERVYYTKNDETDSLEITGRERCYIIDITETEKESLDSLRTTAGNTFVEINNNYTAQISSIVTLNETLTDLNTQIETINTNHTVETTSLNEQITGLGATIDDLSRQISECNSQISDFVAKIAEYETSISTLTTENETLNTSLAAANEIVAGKEGELTTAYSTITTLTAERDALVAYRSEVIAAQKKAIITSYTNQLPEDVIENFLENLDSYNLETLDMILTYEQKKHNPALFSKQPGTPAPAVYVPKDDGGAGHSINDILAKYEK